MTIVERNNTTFSLRHPAQKDKLSSPINLKRNRSSNLQIEPVALEAGMVTKRSLPYFS